MDTRKKRSYHRMMPKKTKEQRRKWRKDAAKRRRQKRRRQQNTFNDKKLQKPWEAVKMRMFEVPNPFPPDFPLEKRQKIFREIGQNAQKIFEEKYLKLGEWFSKYDSLYLLSFCSHYFLSHQEGIDPEATGAMEFYPHYQEWLQAFALTKDRNIDPTPLRGDAQKLFDEIKEIGDAVSMRWAAKLPEGDRDVIEEFRLRLEMMSNTTAVRNWAYFHQMKRVTIDMANKVDGEFEKVYGIKSSIIIELLFAFIDQKTDEMNERRAKLRNVVRQKTIKDMMAAYMETFPVVHEMSDKEMNAMWEAAGKNKRNLMVMMLAHSDLFLHEIYSFDLEYLVNLLPNKAGIDRQKLKEVFDLISIKFGELADWDPEHFILGNPVSSRPFINLGDGNYFTGVMGLIPHIALDILEFLIWKADALKDKYSEIKSDYLEDEVERIVTKHFPNGQVYRSSKYGNDYENDITCVIDSFAIVIEAKSGKVSEPVKRGAPKDLFQTLQRLIEEPSEQALRFINFLSSDKKVHTLPAKKGGMNVIDSTKINYYIPLGITFSNLGMISGNLKKLIAAKVVEKKLEELAPSMSFTDFEIILELLETEPQRLHYLSRRREIEAHLEYEGDEMDLLAFYIDNGFNIGEAEYSCDRAFNIALNSKELDPYIVGTSEGRNIKKPRVKNTQWWEDILDFAARKKSPGWVESCFILYNFPYDDQKEFEKQLRKLKAAVLKGSTEKPHNWGVFVSGAGRRRFAVAVYPYTTNDIDLRNSIMEQIFEDTEKSHTLRGMLVVGQNLTKVHYPYSVIARKASTDLFDVLTLEEKSDPGILSETETIEN